MQFGVELPLLITILHFFSYKNEKEEICSLRSVYFSRFYKYISELTRFFKIVQLNSYNDNLLERIEFHMHQSNILII